MAKLIGQTTVYPFTVGNGNALAADTATLCLASNSARGLVEIWNSTAALLYYCWSEEGQSAVQTAGIDFMTPIPIDGVLFYDILSMPIGTLYLRSVAGGDARVVEGI